jgi:hypothetical protein
MLSIRFLITALCGFLLLGCDLSKRAQKHIDKAERICPDCFTSDTILIEVPGREISTKISLMPGEIRTIQNEGITLRIVNNSLKDTIPPLKIECICDTVYKEVIVPKIITETREREKGFFEKAQDFLFWVFMALLALIVLPRILDLINRK